MTTGQLIEAKEICGYYHIEFTFINHLSDAGLVELTTIDNTAYLPEAELIKLEKMISLHQELEINMEGIEAITHLLERVTLMQSEIMSLKNRLRIYEA
jgi:hypothetical protein